MQITQALAAPHRLTQPIEAIGRFRPKRLLVVLMALALATAPGHLGSLTRSLMVDAYVQVSVFVAATLFLFYGSERVFNFDIGRSLRRSKKLQVPLAALLGAMPGCGGAVVVVAAYSSGNVRFGAVVAGLTATMGDAAFLLIASKPKVAMVVLPLGLLAGIITGWTLDALKIAPEPEEDAPAKALAPLIGRTRTKDLVYLGFAALGLVVGIAQLLAVDLQATFGASMQWVGLVGTFLGLVIWCTSPLQALTHCEDSPATRTAEETSFISVWVIGAYLAFDYLVDFAHLDLKTLFESASLFLPMIAILVGFIPGCGPQILVTTLYINGLLPFAALIGNAISNDGDALFPAIALNPRAAILATLYSAIPATLVAYSFYTLAPGFMG